MRYVYLSLLFMMLMAIGITACGNDDSTGPDPEDLISINNLYETSKDWLIVVGSVEDFEGETFTDAFEIRYLGDGIPDTVSLCIDDSEYSLYPELDDDVIFYSFYGEEPLIETEHSYFLKLMVGGAVVAQCDFRMVESPDLSADGDFDPTQDHDFQWTLNNNSMVQYMLAEVPSGNMTILNTMLPSQRNYILAANTLDADPGWYEFAVVEAKYNEVPNARFVSMFATWIKRQYTH